MRLTEGALDLGGIIKGWTVDLGIAALRERYPNICINAGGDLRCEGSEEGVDGWQMAIEGEGSVDPLGGRHAGRAGDIDDPPAAAGRQIQAGRRTT